MSDAQTTPLYILVDWGTSSFRLWGINADGAVLCQAQEAVGATTLDTGEHEPFLEEALNKLGVPGITPVLICGMAGAVQGWQEAPYIDVPTKLDVPFKSAECVHTKIRDVRILPGVAQRDAGAPDVMRGEETLLLGAQELGFKFSHYCLPGTHSKWVLMSGEEVASFTTFLTGELFALLSEQSTLSHYLKGGKGDEFHREAFKKAFCETLDKPDQFSASLFKFRAGALLDDRSSTVEKRSALSGVLLGIELAAIKPQINAGVGLIATGIHLQTYGLAFEIAGIDYEVLNSEELARSGLSYAAAQIWGQDADE